MACSLLSTFSQMSINSEEIKKSIEEDIISCEGDVSKLSQDKVQFIKQNAAVIGRLSLPKINWQEKTLSEIGNYFPALQSLSLIGGSYEDRYLFVAKRDNECPFGIPSSIKQVILEHCFPKKNIAIEESIAIKTCTAPAFPRFSYSGISKEQGKPVCRKLFP
jgi:hypothetical protein